MDEKLKKIMALVHGELSQKESVELIKEMEKDPELKAMYEQMLEVDSLLKQSSKKEEEWKMDGERRSALLETLGEKKKAEKPEKSEKAKVEELPVAKPHSEQTDKAKQAIDFPWGQVTGVAACVAVTLIVAGQVFEVTAFSSKTFVDRMEPVVTYNAEGELFEETIDSGYLAYSDDASSSLEKAKRGKSESVGRKMNREIDSKESLTISPSENQLGSLSNFKDYDDAIDGDKITNSVQKKPSSPSVAMPAISAKNDSPVGVPMPDIVVETSSPDFGETSGFGSGDVFGFAASGKGGNSSELRPSRNAPGPLAQLPKDEFRPAADPFSYAQPEQEKSLERLQDKNERGFRDDLSKMEEGKELPSKAKYTSKQRRSETGILDSLEAPQFTGSWRTFDAEKQDPSGEHDFKDSEGLEGWRRETDVYYRQARNEAKKLQDERKDYYKSAYDETRAKMLTEVDKAWEIVPAPVEEVEEEKLAKELETKKKKTKEPQKSSEPSHEIKDLTDEITAQQEPFSTFSLHVSDVSFKLAKSALLERGQTPDRNKIRPEEFVNAFDYGDPSVQGHQKVACFMEQARHPFMQQRNLMRVSMSTAALGRSQPLRLTIMLDNSGSMERADREASVLKAMEVLVEQLQPHDQVSLIGFSQKPRIMAEGLKGDQLKQLLHLVKQAPSEGGTNMEEALLLAGQVSKRYQSEGTMSRIVLITDGAANLGNAEPEDLSKMVVELRQQGIAFDACGVGADKLDDAVLEALARKGDGRYYLLDRPEDADEGFVKQLAGALRPAASNVKVQVKFNPARVKNYKLLGFEKHLLKKEDFRDDTVDAAEMASQEAGSAMYQFQALANGRGDVGEVFIRFKDMNTGEMVERSWTIPYLSQPKRIEDAAPSMQLATTAAMLAEKIRNTDVGMVDFSEYGKVLGSLNANFSSDQRVQDLIRMVRKVSNK